MEKTHTGNGFLRFLKGILYLVIAVLMLSSVLLIAESLLFGDRIPGNINWKPAAAKTESMAPTVKKGDLVILRSVRDDDLTVGTVVSYYTDGGYVLGRITERHGSVSLVRGDAETESVAVETAEIRGIWNGTRIPVIGYLVAGVQGAPGIVLIIVAVILLFMIVMAIAHRSEAGGAGDVGDAVVYIPSSESEGLAFVLCSLSLLGGGLYLRHVIRKGGETERGCKR